MKAQELTGELLDYWVARAKVAAGYFTFDSREHDDKPLIQLIGNTWGTVSTWRNRTNYGPFRGPGCGTFASSTDWSYGGPIIERENLYLRDPDPLARHVDSGFDNKWMAAKANHAKREY
jgi:hypothetical protein